MQKITIQSDFTVFETLNELDQEIQNLFNHAEKARQKAYAPYSNFLVGCALLLDNGEIITGSNQENASYPSGLCAERTAIYYAGAKYPEAKVVKMTIIAGSINQVTASPIPPCGACRQAVFEYEFKQKTPIEIYFKGEEGQILKSDSLENMLPLTFNSKYL
ncbi:cytidine deaminase [Aurantibacter aestuarii]|uniref:Cytidine deaminase n=1 Tax=Aurantibacter aestuarii TaxID=1266046 RepID=A0A2T1N6X8_9FLAO|nr:cytidine deaminase [Aurantibacter aestuarii]PSG87337.1 cytidine deaminase [Aurantibacter aestuarii]